MKKWLAVLGVVVSFSIPALADVDCSTVTVCTLNIGDGRCHPAVLFNVVTAQTTQGTFSVCDDDMCGGPCSDPVSFMFDFPQGPTGVFLAFGDEPPPCTTLSTNWVIDACAAACGAHHCVTPTCPVGAEAFLKEIVIKK